MSSKPSHCPLGAFLPNTNATSPLPPTSGTAPIKVARLDTFDSLNDPNVSMNSNAMLPFPYLPSCAPDTDTHTDTHTTERTASSSTSSSSPPPAQASTTPTVTAATPDHQASLGAHPALPSPLHLPHSHPGKTQPLYTLCDGRNSLSDSTMFPSLPLPSDALTPATSSRKSSLSSAYLRPVSRHASTSSSNVPSPVIAALGGLTPLPSPLIGDSPWSWRNLRKSASREALPIKFPLSNNSVLVSSTGESISAAMTSQLQRKELAGQTHHALVGTDGVPGRKCGSEKELAQAHMRSKSMGYISNNSSRNNSIIIANCRLTPVPPSDAEPKDTAHASVELEPPIRREANLVESRDSAPVAGKPPTPPPSESSQTSTDANPTTSPPTSKPDGEIFQAFCRRDRKRRRWRAIKLLGQGTFSRVMLATSQINPTTTAVKSSKNPPGEDGLILSYLPKSLVAVKICEHGPAGGASGDRIEMSLMRELEILLDVSHPSIVNLRAWDVEKTRSLLILSYSPGGDLFEVATTHSEALTPLLLRRIFAELVGAARYLHDQHIVHRDIKLENVLVNLPPSVLASTTTDWATYPYSIITLTDLGLSRRIAPDERLATRCGSDDYAAPEVILGQQYDGRATDAWSLGVLLYALLECRLPFDPPPGVGDPVMQMRMRSRTSHRIARVEWQWIKYGVPDGQDGDGDHCAHLTKFDAQGLRGAMDVVEGLLRKARNRWPLTKVAEMEWVSGGIQLAEGIQFREEDEGEEVEEVSS